MKKIAGKFVCKECFQAPCVCEYCEICRKSHHPDVCDVDLISGEEQQTEIREEEREND